MDSAYVKSEWHQGLRVIEFYHPQSNSLPRKILTELAQAIHAAGNEKETKLIVLRSGGERAFCAGASFDELAAIKKLEEGIHFFSGFAEVINAIRLCPQLVIGRIHGKCVGGGVGLAAAVDYALATEEAEIKLSELTVGLGPFVVGPAVERKIGLSAFTQLSIDATRFRSAEWAQKKGLFAEVFSDIQGLDEGINRIVYELLHSHDAARTELKKVFWEGTAHWGQLLQDRAAISGRLVLSKASKKAIEGLRKK